MLRYFIGKVVGRFNLIRPEVMICIPAGVTSVEQRAVRDAAEQAGARRPAHLIPEPLAAAIGARIPVGTPSGNMIVDIGGGRSEAAVISMYGIVVKESVRVAGDAMDDAIVAYVKRRHNLVIGERTAEEIKIGIGSAIPLERRAGDGGARPRPDHRPAEDDHHDDQRGHAGAAGLPRRPSSRPSAAVLETTPPEMASDVIDRGIVLTGGGALLRGLDELITQETGVPARSPTTRWTASPSAPASRSSTST